MIISYEYHACHKQYGMLPSALLPEIIQQKCYCHATYKRYRQKLHNLWWSLLWIVMISRLS